MATPVRETKGSHRNEESSSRQLFVSSNNLVRDKMDTVRVDAATDKNMGVLQLEEDKLQLRKQVSGTVIYSWMCTG